MLLNVGGAVAEKDIVPEPVEPGGVHPELGGQVDSQGQSAVHGVVEESPVVRRERKSHVRSQDGERTVATRSLALGGGTCISHPGHQSRHI